MIVRASQLSADLYHHLCQKNFRPERGHANARRYGIALCQKMASAGAFGLGFVDTNVATMSTKMLQLPIASCGLAASQLSKRYCAKAH